MKTQSLYSKHLLKPTRKSGHVNFVGEFQRTYKFSEHEWAFDGMILWLSCRHVYLELGPYWITNLVSGDDSLLLHPGTWSSMSIGILGASQLWFKAYQTLSWCFTPWAFSRCFKEKKLEPWLYKRNGKPTTVRSSTVWAIYVHLSQKTMAK